MTLGHYEKDSWIRAAVLTSLAGREVPFLRELASRPNYNPSKAQWAEEVSTLVAARGQQAEIADLVQLAFAPDREAVFADPVINGLATGAQRTGRNLSTLIPEAQKSKLSGRVSIALTTLADAKKPGSARLAALRVGRLGSADALAQACEAMMKTGNPPAVQMAAVQTLAGMPDKTVGEKLVAHWSDLGPAQRREVIEALVARADRLPTLLSAMEAGTIAPTELDIARRKQLLESKTAEIAQRAKAIFGALPSTSRADVLKAFAPATKLSGRVKEGEAVYKKACATCHRAGTATVGADVGPNLLTVVSRSPEDLLGHIIEPNREIAPQYVNYSVAMKDGRVLTGLIASESTNSLVLKRAEGVTETVARSQVEEVRSTGQSLMPEGLEQGLAPQDFADLISYIRQLGSK